MKLRGLLKIALIPICIALLFVILSMFFSKTALEITNNLTHDLLFYEEVKAEQLNWIKKTRLSNGAMALRPSDKGKATVNPYFACYTVYSLMECDGVNSYTLAKEYFDWHFSHLNSESTDYNNLGFTIYDYSMYIENGMVTEERSSGEYDSVDSYAAVLLTALHSYYKSTGDADYFVAHTDEIAGVLGALMQLVKNGLTITKPDYDVVYLMDNTEVLQGLRAAVTLLSEAILPKLKDPQKAQIKELLKETTNLESTLEGQINDVFWNDSGKHYELGLRDKPGGREFMDFSWSEFYPSSSSQLFPIITETISPKDSKAQEVYNHLCDVWDWEKLVHVGTEDTGDYYWGELAYCAALMNDNLRLKSYLLNLRQANYLNNDMLTNADAAWITLACEEKIDEIRPKLKLISLLTFVSETLDKAFRYSDP